MPFEFAILVGRRKRNQAFPDVSNHKDFFVSWQACLVEFGEFKVRKGTAESYLLTWSNLLIRKDEDAVSLKRIFDS